MSRRYVRGVVRAVVCFAIAALVSSAMPEPTLAASARDRRPAAAAPSGTRATVVRVGAAPGAIPSIATARGLTTMISLPEEAKEAICGDLYDAQGNVGGFVLQRSGRDLFVKPLRAATESNLFVKTERRTYAFDLRVVPLASAMRIVYVEDAAPERSIETERARLAGDRAALEAERANAETSVEARRRELEAWARTEAERLAAVRLDEALAAGAILPVPRPRVRSRAIEVSLGPAALAAGNATRLAVTLRNSGSTPLLIGRVAAGRASVEFAATLAPGESVTRVVSFPGRLAAGDQFVVASTAGGELARFRPFD